MALAKMAASSVRPEFGVGDDCDRTGVAPWNWSTATYAMRPNRHQTTDELTVSTN